MKTNVASFVIVVLTFILSTTLIADSSSSITQADLNLIRLAKEKLHNINVEKKHFVVAAIRTKTGRVITGFNLKTTATRASVCAESIALAKVIEAGEEPEILVVIANLEGEKNATLVTPCGICRELLYDYAPQSLLIFSNEDSLIKVPIGSLLPSPYKR